MSPPSTHSTSPKGDDEMVSQRAFPDQGEAPEIVRAASKDDSIAVGHMGEEAPMGNDGGGRVPFGPQSDIIPKTFTAPESGERPSPKGGVCMFCW